MYAAETPVLEIGRILKNKLSPLRVKRLQQPPCRLPFQGCLSSRYVFWFRHCPKYFSVSEGMSVISDIDEEASGDAHQSLTLTHTTKSAADEEHQQPQKKKLHFTPSEKKRIYKAKLSYKQE